MRSGLARSIVCSIACSILLDAPSVHAQTVAGSLFGTLTDGSSARLPGVTVTIVSPELIAGHAVLKTGPEGQYRFPALPAGTYTVIFEAPGFQTVKREGVLLLAGQSLAVDAVLEVAKIADTITIQAGAALIDTRSSAVMNTIDTATLETMPLARNFTELLDLTPGVTNGAVAHGGTVRQNVYNVDGLNTNDPNVSSAGTDMPLDIFQEVQVTTAGVPAEFGEASGAVFNYITKSGGNSFRGTAQFFYQSKDIGSDNISDALEDIGLTPGGFDSQYDATVSVGGPIMKNKVWFFVNARSLEQSDRQSDFPSTLDTTHRQMFVKGTTQLATGHRAELSFFVRDQEVFPAFGQFIYASDSRTWTGIDERDYITTGSWTGTFGNRTVAELRGSSMLTDNLFTNPNNVGAPMYLDQSTQIVTGGDPQFGGTVDRDRWQVKGNVSHFREGLAGSHNVKAGVDWQSGPIDNRQYLRGSRGANELEGCSEACISTIPDTLHVLNADRPFRVRLFNTPILVRSQVDSLAAFLQDQWVLGNRLTLNLGVRTDHFRGRNLTSESGGGRWEPQVTVFPEVELFSVTNVSPRIAGVWDLTGDHQTTIKASYSRFYYQLNTSNTVIASPARGGFREFDWTDRNNDRVYQPGEEGQLRMDTRPDPARLPTVDPDLRNQHNNVTSIGMERALGKSWTASVAGVFKREGDLLATINAAVPFSSYTPITVVNPITGEPMTIYTLRTQFQAVQPQIILTNPGDGPDDPVKLERQYNGVETVLRRRLSGRYSFEASYVWGKGEGNVGNNAGESQNGNYQNPNILINRFGDLSLGPEHQFKLFGTYRAPYGFVFSGFFQAVSGVSWAEGGGLGGTVKGAATVRFTRTAYPQIQSEAFIDVAAESAGTREFDAQTRLDLRGEKQFRITRAGTVSFILDVFNVFNQGTIVAIQTLLYDNPSFGVPAGVQSPRQARLSLKWSF